jgi:hypothetical protein
VPRPSALLSFAALLAAISACAPPEAPQPSPEPAAAYSLVAPDLPDGLQKCPQSGEVGAYLAAVKATDPDTYTVTNDTWQRLVKAGALAGWIVSFSDGSGCGGGLRGTTSGRVASSLVARFADSEAAARAWRGGILGVENPDPAQGTPGLIQGPATGLGPRSWTYDRTASGRPTSLAFWQHASFVVLLVTTGLTADQSHSAAQSMDARVR